MNPFLFIRGLSCPQQCSSTINSKLSYANYTWISCIPVSCDDIGLTKNLCLVFVWKSGLKVPSLTLGPSCTLQTILLSDQVGCDRPLQLADSNIRLVHFFTICSSLSRPTRKVQILKKCPKTFITICIGLSHLTVWAALPSENIPRHFFQEQRNTLRIQRAVYF